MGTAGATFRPITGGGEGEAADAPRPARRPSPAVRRRLPRPRWWTRRGCSAAGGGLGATVQGLSIVKPPHGQIVGIISTRAISCGLTPHGDTPDAVRNHPPSRG